MTTQNAKVTKTLQAIEAALIKLVRTKGLQKITVADITKAAHINRGTFYLHYLDKEDLVDRTEAELFDGVDAILGRYIYEPMSQLAFLDESKDLLREVVTAVGKYALTGQRFALVQALSGPQGDPYFRNRGKELLRKYLAITPNEQTANGIAGQVVQEFIIQGLIDIVLTWFQQQPEQASADELVQLIIDTRFLSPYALLKQLRPTEVEKNGHVTEVDF
ncbi:hypothetical protein IV38_GL001601 [Lactobacillus selangorensis]|uniref:HTH tetR-type domain-containing protein n=1 Tax=Lactobacillus selangorensis TaxID=81857 RepID=A0A0R2FR59_9LACO|nr:TetR/AcrR family transcriptional regulator [Lactobacillus selangorensis]KRN28149.1 hypothetical protein IV38_GL001601 [Lactobacillus selangorensis]KRN30975.1 hypothetical protein IV40_GL001614 [Lactobacillus selangorensis]